jgi:hypothetical protein
MPLMLRDLLLYEKEAEQAKITEQQQIDQARGKVERQDKEEHLAAGQPTEPPTSRWPSLTPRHQNAPKHSVSGRGRTRKCPYPRPRTRMLDSSRA